MNSWWETPLCSKFLENVKEEMNLGNIALIFLPKHSPYGFIPALKRSFEKDHTKQFQRINLGECVQEDLKPVESLLQRHFELDNSTEQFIRKSASEIFKNINFIPSQIFVFENLSPSLLLHFKKFLLDLGRYLASIKVFQRHRVIVTIDATMFRFDDFTHESGIKTIKFQGAFGKLENLIGIKTLFSQDNELVNSLYENIIASLAQFDSLLIKTLMGSDDILIDYQSILLDFAQENGWGKIRFKDPIDLSDVDKWERWANGILEYNGNKIIYHSSYLNIHKKDAELEKRIWISCLEILLPLIEEFRTRLLKCNKCIFPFKFQNQRTGQLKDNILDFEIGDIWQLWVRREVELRGLSKNEKKRLSEFIRISRDIRNGLAHVKLPKSDDIKKFMDDFHNINIILDSFDLTKTIL